MHQVRCTDCRHYQPPFRGDHGPPQPEACRMGPLTFDPVEGLVRGEADPRRKNARGECRDWMQRPVDWGEVAVCAYCVCFVGLVVAAWALGW